MKGKKRFRRLETKTKITFALLLIVVIGSVIVARLEYVYHYMPDEDTIINSYNEKMQQSEKLREILRDTVEAGDGININANIIPDHDSEIKISFDDNVIKYDYCFSNLGEEYKATITLSKDYEVLEENYSVEMESFEEFSKSYNHKCITTSICDGILITILVIDGSVLCMLFLLSIFKRLMKRKKKK